MSPETRKSLADMLRKPINKQCTRHYFCGRNTACAIGEIFQQITGSRRRWCGVGPSGLAQDMGIWVGQLMYDNDTFALTFNKIADRFEEGIYG